MRGDSDISGEVGNVTDAKAEDPVRHVVKRIILLTLLAASLAAVFLFLVLQRGALSEHIVERVQAPSAECAGVYAAHIADAIEDRDVEAREGRLYRVKIDDVSRDSAAGVARIGGLVTFVPGARPGQIAVIELLAVKRNTAEAHLIQVEREAPDVAVSGTDAQAKEGSVREGADSNADDVQPGRLFRVEVTEKDRKNPDVDGVARIGGLVVFVPDSRPGDRAVIRITERAARFAKSVVVDKTSHERSEDGEPGELN